MYIIQARHPNSSKSQATPHHDMINRRPRVGDAIEVRSSLESDEWKYIGRVCQLSDQICFVQDDESKAVHAFTWEFRDGSRNRYHRFKGSSAISQADIVDNW